MTQAAGRLLVAWAYSEANDAAVISHLLGALEQLECNPASLESMGSLKDTAGPYPQSTSPPSGYAICLGSGEVYSRADGRRDSHD